MTWELLVVMLVVAAIAGGAWAYLRRKRSPYGRSLSQMVREGDDRDEQDRPGRR